MKSTQKYYWIKLKTDFFGLDEIDFLLSQKNGSDYVVLYQMLCLMTANNEGELCSRIGDVLIPYDVDKIVRETKHFSRDTVIVAMELFKNLGLIYVQDNDILKVSAVGGMVGSESASKEAVKKRKYREKLKNQNQYLLGDSKGDKEGTNCPTDIRDKRLDIDIKIYKDIVEYLNNKTGSSYKPTSKATKEHINARLKEGFTLEDFKTVIDKKTDEWKGTEFEQYLRPMTLFGTKFESYLNSKPKKKNSDTTYTFEGMDDLDELF